MRGGRRLRNRFLLKGSTTAGLIVDSDTHFCLPSLILPSWVPANRRTPACKCNTHILLLGSRILPLLLLPSSTRVPRGRGSTTCPHGADAAQLTPSTRLVDPCYRYYTTYYSYFLILIPTFASVLNVHRKRYWNSSPLSSLSFCKSQSATASIHSPYFFSTTPSSHFLVGPTYSDVFLFSPLLFLRFPSLHRLSYPFLGHSYILPHSSAMILLISDPTTAILCVLLALFAKYISVTGTLYHHHLSLPYQPGPPLLFDRHGAHGCRATCWYETCFVNGAEANWAEIRSMVQD
ncbi:unnamed protein product [Protopolystoma xenopodis]|uniref:Uncharacterized protein n=1 Tax=Protopolystoma xenopodis TaxID=117903 RepID=A0A3S5A424_9PLAT|nr:unnamed protein product [Protopolystoma xenopodis]